MRILVTGGAGYIGSIAVEMLRQEGFEISVIDDCSTGHSEYLPRDVRFIPGSLLNPPDIAEALWGCDAVIHFAGKSLVAESVENPDLYWHINVEGSQNLIAQMKVAKVSRIVFSSSAATYGAPSSVPILESALTNPTNPYGETKLAIDRILTQEAHLNGLAAISLRYFNVAGSAMSESGWLRERHDPETHLIPNILRSSPANPVGIFGTDWPTPDGTCIRDYVHVLDLVDAHIKALKLLANGKHEIFNLGSGKGYSVREVIYAAELACNRAIPVTDAPRRPGDPAVLVADISKASAVLGWNPSRNINEMVADTFASFGR